MKEAIQEGLAVEDGHNSCHNNTPVGDQWTEASQWIRHWILLWRKNPTKKRAMNFCVVVVGGAAVVESSSFSVVRSIWSITHDYNKSSRPRVFICLVPEILRIFFYWCWIICKIFLYEYFSWKDNKFFSCFFFFGNHKRKCIKNVYSCRHSSIIYSFCVRFNVWF